jgi:DNA-binding transcriptional regulator YiaG
MTAAELSAHLAAHKISAAYLSRVLGVSSRTVRMWQAGDRAIPKPVAKLLALVDSRNLSHSLIEVAEKPNPWDRAG